MTVPRATDPRIVRNVERPPLPAVTAAAELGTATVHESMTLPGVMFGIEPRTDGAQIAGPAVTVLCPAGDNLMFHAAVEVCEPGDVLVVATYPPSPHGMFGELLATSCQARGIAGVILDAGCRDVADISAMGFPVWSRWVSPVGTVKQQQGWVNSTVVCGGVAVTPGDLVVADPDGVVVVPRADVEQVVAGGRAREEREARSRERFRAGELSLDVGGHRGKLD